MATGIGEALRAARTRQGKSLHDAAAETRIRAATLAALEEERFSDLGGHVYVKGFLRSYGRCLELDPEPLVQAYRSVHEPPEANVAALVAAPLEGGRPARPARALLVAGLVAVVLAGLALSGLDRSGAGHRPGERPPAAASTSPSAPAPAPAPAPTVATRTLPRSVPAERPTPVPADAVTVVVEITAERSWLRVTVDGAVEHEGIATAGQVLSFRGTEGITVRAGDAGVVRLTVNGTDEGPMGGRGAVVERTVAPGG